MARPERRAQSPMIPAEVASVCPRCGVEVPRYVPCTTCSYGGDGYSWVGQPVPTQHPAIHPA